MVAQSVVRGQYAPGTVNGRKLAGLPDEPGRESKFAYGNFCGHEGVDRQLARGGRTFYLRTGEEACESAPRKS